MSEIKTTRDRLNAASGAALIGGLLKDKVLFDQIMAGAGLPVPTCYGIAGTDEFLGVAPVPGVYKLGAVAQQLDGMAAFCKPARGMSGDGSFAVTFTGGKARVRDRLLEGDEFAAMLAAHAGDLGRRASSRRLVVQQRVVNHPDLDRLYSGCVNTLRLLTHNRRGRPLAFSAVLRVGAGTSTVDNWHAGGLAIPVDMASGRTHGEGIKKDRTTYSHHPDTGLPVAGLTLPHFPAATRAAETAHRLFPDLRVIGWDVALTPEGPRILEGNMRWTVNLHLLTHPGFHRLMMDEVLA